MVTRSASSRCSLSPIAGGYGSVTTAALRPRSREQPCPSRVTTNYLSLSGSLHPVWRGDADEVERGLQSVTRRATQLEPGPSQLWVIDHDTMLAGLVARVIEAMDGGRQVVHVVRNAVRLEQVGRVLHDLGPQRELACNIELPRVDQKRYVRRLRQFGMPFHRGGLDVEEPGVRVLRVVNRVLAALGERELEVELDRGVR